MKKILFFISLSFIFILNAHANDLKKIDMDIYIKPNGDADIIEKWTAKADEGTELYKTYNNLGESKINDYKVYMDGKEFTYQDYWDIDGVFDDKAYANGINYIDDGLELCFGISSYGEHTYTLTYTITNFVVELTDSQMVYWTLIPRNLNDKVENIYIKVHSDFYYEDTLDVWGYGQGGAPTYVYDGVIEMSNDHSLTSDEYMTMLIKFPLGSFTTDYKIDKTFDYYLNMAEEDAVHYENEQKSKRTSSIAAIFTVIISFIFPVVVSLLVTKSSSVITAKRAIYSKSLKRLPKDLNYFRDIPKDNIFTSFYISNLYSLVKKKTDIFGSVLLKWLKEGYVTIEKIEKTGLFKKSEIVTSIKLGNIVCETSYEEELYRIIKEAAKDNYLDENEFKKWAKNHYNRLFNWFDSINENEYKNFLNDGTITKTVSNERFFAKATFTEDEIIYNKAIELAGLKKFLDEFSNLNEKRSIEVHLWEDYLIYAQMFGIAKKVAEEFKKMYPELVEQMNYDYSDIILLNNFSHNIVSTAEKARSEAIARANSYSSGGGGFSSSGGGGGSFGGGSGGGGFR